MPRTPTRLTGCLLAGDFQGVACDGDREPGIDRGRKRDPDSIRALSHENREGDGRAHASDSVPGDGLPRDVGNVVAVDVAREHDLQVTLAEELAARPVQVAELRRQLQSVAASRDTAPYLLRRVPHRG